MLAKNDAYSPPIPRPNAIVPYATATIIINPKSLDRVAEGARTTLHALAERNRL